MKKMHQRREGRNPKGGVLEGRRNTLGQDNKDRAGHKEQSMKKSRNNGKQKSPGAEEKARNITSGGRKKEEAGGNYWGRS